MTSPHPLPTEREEVLGLIEQIVREAPRRRPTSEDERRAQQILEERFSRQGLGTEWHSFRFNDNLYANLTLHFGVGILATVLSPFAPALALALHLIVAISYWGDSTRRFYLLRRLFPFRPSQNLLATLPASGEPKLRLVIAAHADAAFTGLMFAPKVAAIVAKRPLPGWLGRSLSFATASMVMFAALDLARWLAGPLPWPVHLAEALVGFPAALTFVLGLEVVLRRSLVPGANDDLSGVAALPALARRLAPGKPEELELVFAVTGCEEASMGGADALARDMRRGRWDPANTVFLALDGLTNGTLRYMAGEGEVVLRPVPPWLIASIGRVAAAHLELGPVRGFLPPVGGTDAAAFLAHGFPAGALLCIDDAFGTPRHYHQHSDAPEHLDPEQLLRSIEFTELVVREIAGERLGRLAAPDQATGS